MPTGKIWVGLVLVASAVLMRSGPATVASSPAIAPLLTVVSSRLSVDGVHLGDGRATAGHELRLRHKNPQDCQYNVEFDAADHVVAVNGDELELDNKRILKAETNRERVTAVLGAPTEVKGMPAMCAFSARPFWEEPLDGYLEYRQSGLQVAFGFPSQTPYRLAIDGTPDDWHRR